MAVHPNDQLLLHNQDWKLGVVAHVCNPGPGRQKSQEFEAILTYILSSKQAWATRDPVSLKKKKNIIMKNRLYL